MTADVELLPLPERVEVDKHLPTGVRIYAYDANTLKNYARANVEHHTAAQAAEIEALRSEVGALRRERAELLDKLNGTPCAEVRWQQELDEAAAALEAEREDATDAERWRFVREQSPATIRLDGNMRGSGLPDGLAPSYYRANTAEELDAAIDQARGKGSVPEQGEE